MTAHIHAESMRLYAEDAAETDRPWERWEFCRKGSVPWTGLCAQPFWDVGREYRRKPKTLTVNVTIPEPLRTAPKDGTTVWMLDITCAAPAIRFGWCGSTLQLRWLERGLIFATEEAANAAATAIIGALRSNSIDNN